MAKKPAAAPPAAENPNEIEAKERLREARRWKESSRVLDFKECYFFAAPHRQRQISSQSIPSTAPMLDAPELYTDLAFELVTDFVTEVVNTYMPEAQIWCERRAGMDVAQELFDKVAEEVKAADRKIFDAIKASNFYSEIPKAMNPDLAIAGAGLWIHRRAPHLPIECLAVPMREMEINLGPNGEVDDRFVVRHSRNAYVKTLVGQEVWDKIPVETRTEIENNRDDNKRTEVVWGYWRKWDRLDDEVWQHVIMVKGRLVHHVEITGEGCCPFIVMRFNPTADWSWAVGPMIQGLPSLRQVDELERQKMEAVERSTNPPITYPDDSFAEVEQGLEPGMAYPIRPGSEGAVKPIYDQPTINPEIFEIQQKEHKLRKLFFIDYPEQTGDTPPTLGQWLDEMARAQRRIGTPGMSFWREGPMRIFQRFKYLLEKAMTIPAVTTKDGRAISTQPYNPTQRAAEQQEIATAVQLAQLGAQMFPEEWRLVVDGKATLEAFISKMRVSGLIKMRSKKDVEAALAQISQLAGLRQQAGPEPAQGAGAPAAM